MDIGGACHTSDWRGSLPRRTTCMDIGGACHVALQVDSRRKAPCPPPTTQPAVTAVTLPAGQIRRDSFEENRGGPDGGACTAPHLEFLMSSLDWVSGAPRRAPRTTAPTSCCLRPAAYPPGNSAKEVLPLPRRRGFVKMCLRYWGDEAAATSADSSHLS
jgi:hypothetical protein